ncbi:MAG TPA: indole-3-glycerol phosphate synthase TrpC [Candidatus Dormibacteraeota bacterium]|nr:indole-3-glycerol phosphate synthase TrpC [Candidatus Dormibacteraeota bacterium]
MPSTVLRGDVPPHQSRILQDILDETAEEVEERRLVTPQAKLERLAAAAPAVRDFKAAIVRPVLAVIAEIKAKSPSAGTLVVAYRPSSIATAYEAAGAAALSVLTQRSRFGGWPDHLALARRATRLPVLRKDFVTDPYQVFEARAYGADAVLLIVAAMERTLLVELLALVRRLGMTALVEIHTTGELAVAAEIGADVIGINHRNLKTMTVDTGLTARLRPRVPSGTVLVAESGIREAADARRMRAVGADAVLVGESLLRAEDPRELIREMTRAERP